MSTTFRIAEVAQRSGFTPATLRYYEDIGLLAPASRQIAELTTLAADLQRAAATLSAAPVDGPCDDTCGCTTDPVPATTATSVPLVAKADAAHVEDTAGEVPIACTLGAGEMATRLDEWNVLLADKQELLQGVTSRQALADGLRLEFGPQTDVAEIARLASAEQGCCRFFSFALVMDGRGSALEVHAPPDGQPALTALFGAAG